VSPAEKAQPRRAAKPEERGVFDRVKDIFN